MTVSYDNAWRWSVQTGSPPINGQIRTDLGEWADATHVYISNTTDDGQDVGALLQTIAVFSSLDLKHRTDGTRNVSYTVASAPVAQATYVDVPVIYVESAGTLPNGGTVIAVSMSLEQPMTTGEAVLSFQSTFRPDGWIVAVECADGRTESYLVLGTPHQPTWEDAIDAVPNHHRRFPECDHWPPSVDPLGGQAGPLAAGDGPMAVTVAGTVRPSRYTITAACRHGTLVEYVAVQPAAPPTEIAMTNTTAQNLRKRTGCGCYLP